MQHRLRPVDEHLEELRRRIWISVAALAVGVGVGYSVARPALHWALVHVGMPHVIAIGVTDGFYAILRIAFIIGLGLSLPVMLYEAAAFVLPGLVPRERRVVLVSIVPALLLFLGGVFAGFLWVVPAMLRVMMEFMGNGVQPQITLGNLFSFIVNVSLPFGIVAELPLVTGVLSYLGILEPAWLGHQRRYAVMAAFVAAAALAPPDAVSMLIMALPVYLLYEASVLITAVCWKARLRQVKRISQAAL